ncbi:hypothetical protein CR152_27055 [Massilia violaceinigra]|uniref:SMP-30/Gluconolactonase/LRE-like region domain-containing protein n=1 Tax=Massilia violaceinigra TaxID=2045208 RepID=A0A2D2DRZ6_9BURK|nr:hypothetical protein [Massilia violaceinigra]ATQ77751.1 hypothetical protein CR152_27055 [Massilia violaceinigra]
MTSKPSTPGRQVILNHSLSLALCAALAACGGGGGGGNPAPPTSVQSYEIGGTVAGLEWGVPLSLANGGDSVVVDRDGTFQFRQRGREGAPYAVAVTAPAGRSCSVTDGAGTVGKGAVSNIRVNCFPLILAGTAVPLHTSSGMSMDKSGNTFIMDLGRQVVLRITPAGAISTLAGSASVFGAQDGAAGAASFHFDRRSRMIVDGVGNLILADTCNNTLRKITPAGLVSTIAGTPRRVCVYAKKAVEIRDGAGAAALFDQPFELALATNGDYLVLEQGARYRRVTPAGVVTTVGWTNPAGSAAPLTQPHLVAMGKDGTLYAADYSKVYTIAGGVATLLAGDGDDTKQLSDGMGRSAVFGALSSMKVDAVGDLFLSDVGMVRKMTPAGLVSTLAGGADSNIGPPGYGNGPRLAFSGMLAFDPAGNIARLGDDDVLQTITRSGVVTTSAATPYYMGSSDGAGSNARFLQTARLSVDAAGSLYFADSNYRVVRKIIPEGVVTTFAGSRGSWSASLDPIQFVFPRAVALDAAGAVYVADTRWIGKIVAGKMTAITPTPALPRIVEMRIDAQGNVLASMPEKVVRITPSGQVSVLVDVQRMLKATGLTDPSDGFNPTGLTLDAAGNLYIADTVSATILKLDKQDVLSVFAGVPGRHGSADGPARSTALGFYSPVQMSFAPNGDLYMSGHGKVRKISPDGWLSTPQLGWGNVDIHSMVYSQGKLYGMTAGAVMQTVLPPN